MIGQTVSQYRIVEKLGEGGMGVVWKARDEKLERFVALKTLPASRMADQARIARFLQEARAASALNHPNIVTIHDLIHQEGASYLVMEFIEGRTLEEMIGNRAVRLSEALGIGIQIAGALAKAHAAGIVHRDLKPGNIMVTPDGHVKILDFGLAKLIESEGPRTGEHAATATLSRTDEGAILGTVAYMSPEQVEGRGLDARSDIFSFGSLLYELLTGRPAFATGSRYSTLAAILEKDPAPAEHLPREVQRTLARCLRKDPARRFQTMADLRVALEDLKEEFDSGELPAAAQSRAAPRSAIWRWAPLTLLVLVATVLVWRFRFANAPLAFDPPPVPFTTDPGMETNPTFSPDGNQVAYMAGSPPGIFIKIVGSGEAVRLTPEGAPAISPVWSPDGRWVAYRSPRGIHLRPPIGGVERKIADRAGPGGSMSWMPDGRHLLVADREAPEGPSAISLLNIETGDARRIVTPVSGTSSDRDPVFVGSPRGVAFGRRTESGWNIFFQPLDHIDQPQGEPRRLTDFRAVNLWGLAWDGNDYLYASAETTDAQIWRIPISGGEASPVDLWGQAGQGLAIAPGRKRLVFARTRSEEKIQRLELGGDPAPFLASTTEESGAQFSPDGERIAFTSARSGAREIWVAKSDGSGLVQLTTLKQAASPDWSPDGQWIAFQSAATGDSEIYRVRSGGGRVERLTERLANDVSPRWSPDGQWIYFGSTRSGRFEIWRMKPDGGSPQEITRDGGATPGFGADTSTLYFSRDHAFCAPNPAQRGIWRMPTAGGTPERLIEDCVRRSFFVTADGIYYIPQSGPQSAIRESAIQFWEFATKRSRKIASVANPGSWRLSVSRDRRTFLYTRRDPGESDLMLVEGIR